MTEHTDFARLVSLACHDLRTPLATVFGFARTLSSGGELDETCAGYARMIESASDQIAGLIDELSLAARIESGRYEPRLEPVGTAALAAAAAERLGGDRVTLSGGGADVSVDPEATRRAVSALVRCALRHGGLGCVAVAAEGLTLQVSPITPASAPVVLGHDLRDLGAAVAVMYLRRLGGSVAVANETLTIRFPAR